MAGGGSVVHSITLKNLRFFYVFDGLGVVIWDGWGILAPFLYDVVRSWRQDGSKIEKNHSSRRSWGRLGAKLGPIFFSKTRPEAPGPEKLTKLTSAGGGGVTPGRVRVGKSPPGLDFRIRYGCLTRRSSTKRATPD